MRALLIVAAALLFAPAALADEGMPEGDATQTAQVLSRQALAILDAGLSPGEALEKLDAALDAGDQTGVDARALRAAREALERKEVETARNLLHGVFPGDASHLVGVTYRRSVGTGEIVALGLGALAIVLAAFGLARRRRAERALA